MPNSDFITVVTPDGEIWADQEYFIRKDVVTGLRLVKKLSPQGADNALARCQNRRYKRGVEFKLREGTMIWTGWLALGVVCGVVVLYIGEKLDSRALPVDDDMGLMDLLAVLILLLILVLPIR